MSTFKSVVLDFTEISGFLHVHCLPHDHDTSFIGADLADYSSRIDIDDPNLSLRIIIREEFHDVQHAAMSVSNLCQWILDHKYFAMFGIIVRKKHSHSVSVRRSLQMLPAFIGMF